MCVFCFNTSDQSCNLWAASAATHTWLQKCRPIERHKYWRKNTIKRRQQQTEQAKCNFWQDVDVAADADVTPIATVPLSRCEMETTLGNTPAIDVDLYVLAIMYVCVWCMFVFVFRLNGELHCVNAIDEMAGTKKTEG